MVGRSGARVDWEKGLPFISPCHVFPNVRNCICPLSKNKKASAEFKKLTFPQLNEIKLNVGLCGEIFLVTISTVFSTCFNETGIKSPELNNLIIYLDL